MIKCNYKLLIAKDAKLDYIIRKGEVNVYW